MHIGQIRPALPSAVQEPLVQRDLGGVGDRPGHRPIIEQVRPNRPTSLLAVAEVTQFHGNRSAYDAETLVMLLEGAGFVDVDWRGFRESKTLEPVPDLEERRLETLYAEGTKPS
jgi:hypothetical protein